MLATMLHQWAGQYIMITQQQRSSPQSKARVRAFFSDSLNGLQILLMVEGLRVMIHLSLFLFFAGLTIFLFNTNDSVFGAVVWWMALSTATYIYITLLPIFRPSSPFHTPLSSTIWFLYTGIPYVAFGVLSRVFSTSRRCHKLKKYYHKRLVEGMGKTAEKTASRLSSEMDVRVLISSLGNLGEDGVGEEFFKAIPGIFNSDQVNNLEGHVLQVLRFKFEQASNDFLSRTFSSHSISESARSDRLVICLDATHAVLGPDGVSQILFNILDGRWRQSVEMGHSLRRWSDSADQQYTPFVRGIVAQIIAGSRERDVRWIALVRQEFGIPDQALLANVDDDDSALLSVLLYMIRQAIRTGSWTPWTLSSLSQFDIRNTLLKLQHEFCRLWNDIVLDAQNAGADSISILILKEIRHAYIRLHQGTDAAPTTFSDRTYHFDPVLTHPSTYRLCDIPDHLREWFHQRPDIKDVATPPTRKRILSFPLSGSRPGDSFNPPSLSTPSASQRLIGKVDRGHIVHASPGETKEENIAPLFPPSTDMALRPLAHAFAHSRPFTSVSPLNPPMQIAQDVASVTALSAPERIHSITVLRNTEDAKQRHPTEISHPPCQSALPAFDNITNGVPSHEPTHHRYPPEMEETSRALTTTFDPPPNTNPLTTGPHAPSCSEESELRSIHTIPCTNYGAPLVDIPNTRQDITLVATASKPLRSNGLSDILENDIATPSVSSCTSEMSTMANLILQAIPTHGDTLQNNDRTIIVSPTIVSDSRSSPLLPPPLCNDIIPAEHDTSVERILVQADHALGSTSSST